MKSIKTAMLACLMFCGSGALCHALIAYTPLTYEFEAANGQPTIFDGSAITIGIPSVNTSDIVINFDIQDPNAPGGDVVRFMGTAELGLESITSASASGWFGSFTVDYTDVLNQSETLTIVGDGSMGTITDSDPDMASGTWTTARTVPDRSSTMLLLGLATATLGGMHFLQSSKSGRPSAA